MYIYIYTYIYNTYIYIYYIYIIYIIYIYIYIFVHFLAADQGHVERMAVQDRVVCTMVYFKNTKRFGTAGRDSGSICVLLLLNKSHLNPPCLKVLRYDGSGKIGSPVPLVPWNWVVPCPPRPIMYWAVSRSSANSLTFSVV